MPEKDRKSEKNAQEKTREFVIRPKTTDGTQQTGPNSNSKDRQMDKSSYLSWILDPERTPFSEQSRVYSLPQYEEDFWNDMLSKGDPAKNLDPGYLTLDKVSFHQILV